MEEVIVLQLTPVVEKDVYLLVSGSGMINFDTSVALGKRSVGRIMDLSDK